MSKKLAIKGHSTRGKEVIELLEMMAGHCPVEMYGSCENRCYLIKDNGWVGWDYIGPEEIDKYNIFTLEEFLEKYPFKVGDRVLIPEYESEVRICKMSWDGFEIQYKVYRNEDPEWYTAEELLNYNDDFLEDKHCKNQVNGMKNVLAELLDHIKNTSKEELEKEFNELEEWSHVGPTVEEFMDFCNKVNKKPKYPTTYDECCEIMCVELWNTLWGGDATEYEKQTEKLINALIKLKVCRDAYWKIAGEEMGLGKPWEPSWQKTEERKFCIIRRNDNVVTKWETKTIVRFLAFPTEEMRDAFYENFKDLIEQCKELL